MLVAVVTKRHNGAAVLHMYALAGRGRRRRLSCVEGWCWRGWSQGGRSFGPDV